MAKKDKKSNILVVVSKKLKKSADHIETLNTKKSSCSELIEHEPIIEPEKSIEHEPIIEPEKSIEHEPIIEPEKSIEHSKKIYSTEVNEQLIFIGNLLNINDRSDYHKKYNTLLYFLLFLIGGFFTIEFFFKDITIYYFYSTVFFVFILYLSKSIWKTIAILISIFGVLKYLFYNYELSNYYYNEINFDIHIIFISLLLFFSVFIIELLLILVYLFYFMSVVIINSFKFFLDYSMKNNKIAVLQFLIPPLICIIMCFTPFGFIYVWLLPFIIISICISYVYVCFIEIIEMIKNKDKNNKRKEKMWYDFFKDEKRLYDVFSTTFDINKKISGFHENLTFIQTHSFVSLKKYAKVFFLFLTIVLFVKIFTFINYMDSYNYNLLFYKDNKGYCTNLSNNAILKTKDRNVALLLSYEKIKDGYLLKNGPIDFSIKDKLIIKFYHFKKEYLNEPSDFDKLSKYTEYFVYEHNYNK